MRISHWMIVLGLVAALLPWVPLDWIPNIKPGPNPPPTPDEVIPAGGLRVLVVVESAEVTPQQSTVIYAGAWQNRVVEKRGEWRVFDPDVTIPPGEWKTLMDSPRESLPWIIVTNGRTGFKGPLPGSVEEVLALIERHGG